MFGLDEWVGGLAQGGGLDLVLLVALLLGLRHASDPDHLAAVSTLIASEPGDGTRSAGRLGLAWGGGHALALAVFGLPVVLLNAYLSETAQRTAEALVGVMITFLAVRLLMRWRSGLFLAGAHAQRPEARLGRSPWQAFGIGLAHGTGGSAGIGVLLLATVPGQVEAVAALLVLAAGTAVSMALLSSAFGYAIARGPVVSHMPAFAPAMGVVTLAFGCWYALAAVGAVPYGL